MKFDFPSYTYFNPDLSLPNTFNQWNQNTAQSYNGPISNKAEEDIKQNYAYNPKEYQSYLDDYDFQGAANYLKQFRFKEAKNQRFLENKIAELKHKGRRWSSIFNKIQDEPSRQAVKFYSSYESGTLDNLKDNKFRDEYVELKQKLGSKYRSDGNGGVTYDKEATRLSVTFQPKKRTLFGIDNKIADALLADNPVSFDYFLETTGFTPEFLQANGIEVTYPDGRPTITFDKTNPYSDRIIANIPYIDDRDDFTRGMDEFKRKHPEAYYATMAGTLGMSKIAHEASRASDFIINGLGSILNGELIHNSTPTLKAYDSDGNEIDVSMFEQPGQDGDLMKIQNLVNDSRNVKDKWFSKDNTTDKLYSSTIIGFVSDGLENLREQYLSGAIDANQYKYAYSKYEDKVRSLIGSIGSQNYKIYSNGFNEEPTNQTLHELDNTQKSQALAHISSITDSSQLRLQTMTTNGQYGVLITIGAQSEDKKNINTESTTADMTKSRVFQYFIPGLLSEAIQEQMNRNSELRAIKEINEMQDYNYTYTTTKNETITPVGNGIFQYQDKQISKDEAEWLIKKDMAVDDATRHLKFQFINKRNQLIDEDKFKAYAQIAAQQIGDELYPNMPIINPTTNLPYTVAELFTHMGIGGIADASLITDLYETQQFDVADKIAEIFRIYNEINSSADPYRR